ncbi:MAG TPA: polysaccharide biosynthesis protein, partial [Luteimonas sp.]|nr:polysaccharide biosynthesis protein [Luteimonas sp.]
MSSWKDRVSIGMPRAAIVAHDLLMVWACWLGLHHFRYSITGNAAGTTLWSVEIALILLVQGLIFWKVGLYRGVWRFASIPDLVNIMKASVFGFLAILPVLFFVFDRADQVPRTVMLLYPVMLSALLGMP